MRRYQTGSTKRAYRMAFGSDPPPPPKPFHLRYPNIYAGRRLKDWIIYIIIMFNRNVPIDVVQRGLRVVFGLLLTRTEINRYYNTFRKFFS